MVRELETLGLTNETIKDLLEVSTGDTKSASIDYVFNGTTRSVQPRLSFTIGTDESQIDELSVNTRTALRDLLHRASEEHIDLELITTYDPVESKGLEERLESLKFEIHPATDDMTDIDQPKNGHSQTIAVHLNSDTEFFEMLSQEVEKLDDLQAREQKSVLKEIEDLGNKVSALVQPNINGKINPNLAAWRQILRLYEDAGIFKPASEVQRKSHNPEQAAQQLTWYTNEVEKLGIMNTNAKNAQSKALFETFNALNLAILKQIRFQHMNHQAMDKILKKFDKRTALTAKKSFPTFMAADPFFTNGLAQAMHFALASNLLSVVPQLDDYECPVCTSITIKPVRLSCSHVFCVRCLIRLQMAKENHCPICRRENVLQADSTNIDHALLNFLKMYFPIESREKQKQNEREQLRAAATAAGMGDKECLIM